MKHVVSGLHHITAIAGQPQRNYDFYTRLLGLRLIKKTVDPDDPSAYHFFYSNEAGSPGTILTFIASSHAVPGHTGARQVSAVGFSVPAGSFPFWIARLQAHHVSCRLLAERFNEPCLAFSDPDGLPLELIVSSTPDERHPWTTPETGPEVALRGFHYVQLTLATATGTVALLTEVLGYRVLWQQDSRWRLRTDAVRDAAIVDVVEMPSESQEVIGSGSVHHVAFRITEEAVLMHFQEALVARHLSVTPIIDQQYFHALYFHEPGSLLFGLATDTPGFLIDEPLAELGTHLVLPPQYESRRAQIMAHLPRLL
jgi:glyoxalase family protein